MLPRRRGVLGAEGAIVCDGRTCKWCGKSVAGASRGRDRSRVCQPHERNESGTVSSMSRLACQGQGEAGPGRRGGEFQIQLSNSERICVRIVATRCARALRRLPPSEEQEGAGKAGCALHPRSRVQQCTKKRTRAYRSSGGNPAFPARWFTAYSALSPVTGLSCHRHPREVLLPANLTPASGRQDHTASPSARLAFVCRKLRVHRIPPRVRDDREPPLSSGETRGARALICPTS